MAEPARARVLLTGARGFVGRAILAELVARGIAVEAVSHSGAGPALPGVRWWRADLLDPGARRRLIDDTISPCLIHAAWDVTHGQFWNAAINTDWQHASVDLVARFRARGGARVAALGSCAEYDAQTPGPWDETRPIAPSSAYGRTKAELHAELARICGPDLIWARLFHLFGPGEDRRRLIPSLIDALRAGQPAEVRAADLLRDYASTAHVAFCLVSLLESPASGAFDIGSGAPRRLGQLAEILADLTGRPDLLRLSHSPGSQDPPEMAPRLTRLHQAIGPRREHPEQALARLLLEEPQPLRAR